MLRNPFNLKSRTYFPDCRI